VTVGRAKRGQTLTPQGVLADILLVAMGGERPHRTRKHLINGLTRRRR
jgi:hypothetical protein